MKIDKIPLGYNTSMLPVYRYIYHFWPANELTREEQNVRYYTHFTETRPPVVLWYQGHIVMIVRGTRQDDRYFTGASPVMRRDINHDQAREIGTKLTQLGQQQRVKYRKITL